MITETFPNRFVVRVDKTYTERKTRAEASTRVRAKCLSFGAFVGWAIEELNLGPHAYQANRTKAARAELRTPIELPASRSLGLRKETASQRAHIRRQRVDSSAFTGGAL